MSRRYDDLVALAEVELELARAADFEALPPVQAAWRDLVAELPELPPAFAATQLRRAAVLNEQSRAILDAHVRAMRDALSRIDHGRTAIRGYAPAALRDGARVDQAG